MLIEYEKIYIKIFYTACNVVREGETGTITFSVTGTNQSFLNSESKQGTCAPGQGFNINSSKLIFI
jgi:hypothetical protein